MLLAIAAVLLVLWALGFVVFHITSAVIHLLLIIALVVGIVHLFRGSRAT